MPLCRGFLRRQRRSGVYSAAAAVHHVSAIVLSVDESQCVKPYAGGFVGACPFALQQAARNQRVERLGGVSSAVHAHPLISSRCEWSQVFSAAQVAAGDTRHRNPEFVAPEFRVAIRSLGNPVDGFDGATLLPRNVVDACGVKFDESSVGAGDADSTLPSGDLDAPLVVLQLVVAERDPLGRLAGLVMDVDERVQPELPCSLHVFAADCRVVMQHCKAARDGELDALRKVESDPGFTVRVTLAGDRIESLSYGEDGKGDLLQRVSLPSKYGTHQESHLPRYGSNGDSARSLEQLRRGGGKRAAAAHARAERHPLADGKPAERTR